MPSVHRNAVSTCSTDDTMSAGPANQPSASAAPPSNDVVSWDPGSLQSMPRAATPDAGPTCSPHELALALQAHRNRRNAMEALTNAMEPLAAVVEAANSGAYGVRLLEFHKATEKDPAFQQLLETFSKEEISEALGRLVRDAAPDAEEGAVKAIQQRLVSEIDQRVLQRAASAMRAEVVAKLQRAAAGFEQLAEREPQGETLRAHAKLMRHEAERMSTAGETTLYRGLLLHSAALGPQSSIPGSWAHDGTRAVLARGESDEATIARAKAAAAVGVAVASGGMGLGAVAGVGMAAGYNAPGVLTAWLSIDQARAGALSGTAAPDAVEAAQWKAVVTTGEAVVSMVAAGGLGHHAAHAVEHGTFNAGKSALIDGAIEEGIGLAAHSIGH